MRFFRIFLLQMQTVFHERGKAFVWFLMAALNPLILVLFWKGAAGNKFIAPGWNFASLASYYFILTVAFSLLICHQEADVALNDIKDGNLVSYLTKPVSYFWKKFLEELPYRCIQSFYGIVICIVFFFIFGKQLFVFSNSLIVILLSILIILLGLLISFTLRMIMGISAFWFTDSRGFFQAMYAIEFALGGTLIPLILLPAVIAQMAYALPFSYILYFPIITLQGKLGIAEIFHVFGMQLFWLTMLGFIYQILWTHGVKKFSGVGQ